MATFAQVQANRENSKLSTGPTSEAGKAVSSRNHLVHGLCSVDPVLPSEDRDQFNQLVEAFKLEWSPNGLHQEILVSTMAGAQWKLDRIARIEIDMLAKLDDPAQSFTEKETAAAFARLDRYRASLERTFHRCACELQTLRKEQVRNEAKMRQAAEKADFDAFKAYLLAPPPRRNRERMAESRGPLTDGPPPDDLS